MGDEEPGAASAGGQAADASGRPRQFGTDLGGLDPSDRVPRIVAYLCEFLTLWGTELDERNRRSEQGIPLNLEDRVEMLLDSPVSAATMEAARARFELGDFHNVGSPGCMVGLLKAWICELPEPLVPRALFQPAMEMAQRHLAEVVEMLRASEAYPGFLSGHCTYEEERRALDEWLLALGRGADPTLRPEPVFAKAARVLETAAFSVSHSLPGLAELFFRLPKRNRDVLEHIGVACAKVDLVGRRAAEADAQARGPGDEADRSPGILRRLGDALSPHVATPAVWTAPQSRLRSAFFATFLVWIKRKHNLVTAGERRVLAAGTAAACAAALSAETAASVLLARAFSPRGRGSAPATPPVTPGKGREPDPVLASAAQHAVVREPGRDGVLRVRLADGGAGAAEGSAPPLVCCTWEQTPGERGRTDAMLAQCPNLRKWLHEPHLPTEGATPQPESYFALARLPESSVFDAGLGEHLVGGEGEDAVPAPGQDLLPLLGPEYVPVRKVGLELLRYPGPADALSRGLSPVTQGLQQGADARPGSPFVTTTPAGVRGLNWDFPLAFPRVVPDVGTNRAPEECDVIGRFLAVAHGSRKVEYSADSEPGLLRHTLVPDPPSGVLTCEACGTGLRFTLLRSRGQQCLYCGRVLCSTCCSSRFIIPALAVTAGELSPHPVCTQCEQHLQRHVTVPAIELARFTATARRALGVPMLDRLDQLRTDTIMLLYFAILPDCPSREFMVSLIPKGCVPYLTLFKGSYGARLSIAGLCALQTPEPLAALESLGELLRAHVAGCPSCSMATRPCCAYDLCTGAGADDTSLFSSDSSSVGSSGSLESEANAVRSGPRSLTLDSTPALCRTCRGFCCDGCFSAATQQCLLCARLRPGLAPTVKMVGDAHIAVPEDAALWAMAITEHFRVPGRV